MNTIKITTIAFLVVPSCMTSLGQEQVRLFLAADTETQMDTFMVPLTDELDIEYARTLVAANQQGIPTGGATIVVALLTKATADESHLNRNFFRPTAPEWSWKVNLFLEWVDGVWPVNDGTASSVESDVDGWISNHQVPGYPDDSGIFSFSSYRIFAEFPLQDMRSIDEHMWESSIGTVNLDHWPWIWHDTLGWTYLLGLNPDNPFRASPTNIWLFSPMEKWLWTSEGYYPWVWAFHQQEWFRAD